MDTFLVQVWVAGDEPSRGGDLRGVVRHVATGTETAFRSEGEVLDLLRWAGQRLQPEHPEVAPNNNCLLQRHGENKDVCFTEPPRDSILRRLPPVDSASQGSCP